MEGERVRALMVVCVLVGLLMRGQATAASFGACYTDCHHICGISPSKKSSIRCPLECMENCLFNSNSLMESFGVQYTSAHNICTLQCAYPNCTNVTSMNDPREKEIGSCMNNCGKGCSEKKTNSP